MFPLHTNTSVAGSGLHIFAWWGGSGRDNVEEGPDETMAAEEQSSCQIWAKGGKPGGPCVPAGVLKGSRALQIPLGQLENLQERLTQPSPLECQHPDHSRD